MKKLPSNVLIFLDSQTLPLIPKASPSDVEGIDAFLDRYMPDRKSVAEIIKFYRDICLVVLNLEEAASDEDIFRATLSLAEQIDDVLQTQVEMGTKVPAAKKVLEIDFTGNVSEWRFKSFRGIATMFLNLDEDAEPSEIVAATRALVAALGKNDFSSIPNVLALSAEDNSVRLQLSLSVSDWVKSAPKISPLSTTDEKTRQMLGLSIEDWQKA